MPRISHRTDSQIPMTPFTKKVLAYIKKIPSGKVASYGQIAALSGKPQGSRGVGWILHSCTRSHQLPWQRVLGSTGKISFPSYSKEFKEQRRLLGREGVIVSENGKVDLEKYGWKKKPAKPRASQGPRMFA